MHHDRGRSRAAIGFVVKSGWATAVLLGGPASSPCVVANRKLELSDPAVPEARQPYHDGFATARSVGPRQTQLLALVDRFGRRSVSDLIREFKTAEYQLAGAGIVVGSLVDPAALANDHMRIHALEGRLFRGVVAGAVAANGLAYTIWRERDLYKVAVGILARPEDKIRGTLTGLGRGSAGSWRVEQKSAALAAWLVLNRALAPTS